MKTITLKYDGKDYTLEYNRESVVKMEKMGLKLTNLDDIGLSEISILFKGAFLKNHPQTSQTVIDSLYESLTNKQTFLQKMVEMFTETITTLFDEPDDKSKKVEWEASF